MTNTTTSTTYAFESRQRSLAPTSATLQGRAVSSAGRMTGWAIFAPVSKPVGGHVAAQGRIGTDALVFGTTPPAFRLIDSRLRRTSPL